MQNLGIKMNKPEIPKLTLSGNLFEVLKSDFYKCTICGQIFERKKECPIFHSMHCTGE
jgi:rubrerythrin